MTDAPDSTDDTDDDTVLARGPGVVRAAGAVLWRLGADGGPEVAVVHRPHHGDWSLPKGKVDPGESRATTAVRELAEETGFAAALGRHLTRVRYSVGGTPKTVDYWDARAGEGRFTPNGETDELRWLAPPAAARRCTYRSDRDVIAEFERAPFPLRSLLLVRHAKAGKRAGWDGADAERPLVAEGMEQAGHVTDLLACHGVTALYAVPNARCVQTLGPMAFRLGTGVVREPAFADAAVADDPDGARRRLLEILAGPAVAAVCAQGDGIPELVRGLAADRPGGPAAVVGNRRLAEPPARKGSVWTLTFHRPGSRAPDQAPDRTPDRRPGRANGRAGADGWELVAADYTRDAAH